MLYNIDPIVTSVLAEHQCCVSNAQHNAGCSNAYFTNRSDKLTNIGVVSVYFRIFVVL